MDRSTPLLLRSAYTSLIPATVRFILMLPQIRDITLMLIIAIFFVIEWYGRESSYALEFLEKKLPLPFRWLFYILIIASIVSHVGSDKQFIYFQF